MRWPRWIAAFCTLFTTFASAQSPDLPSTESPKSETVQVPTPIELPEPAPVRNGTDNSGSSFEAELDKLRQEIATTKTLREQVSEATSAPLATNEQVAANQRRELMEMLTKLATKNLVAKPAPPVAAPAPQPVIIVEPEVVQTKPIVQSEVKPAPEQPHPLITDKVVDAYALGRALFRAQDFVGAEQAFHKVTVTDDNRVLLQYLIATCLRKQSRWIDAAKAYRVVAENPDDPALRDLAKWQLDNIRWYQQSETQIEKLRKMRDKANGSKTPPKTADKSPLFQ